MSKVKSDNHKGKPRQAHTQFIDSLYVLLYAPVYVKSRVMAARE
ncbi:hypothetical protein SAMN05421747_112104 [Parapedobacter composti]|uniref:Uncharacterized protein n=1 Tax=Parapedobacter composti TaxID=623281 RepID=A0A1I1JL67_9SPHI|nr:hypothetical protein SAMN05421747_112104 [Parapedobacter composti]